MLPNRKNLGLTLLTLGALLIGAAAAPAQTRIQYSEPPLAAPAGPMLTDEPTYPLIMSAPPAVPNSGPSLQPLPEQLQRLPVGQGPESFQNPAQSFYPAQPPFATVPNYASPPLTAAPVLPPTTVPGPGQVPGRSGCGCQSPYGHFRVIFRRTIRDRWQDMGAFPTRQQARRAAINIEDQGYWARIIAQ